MGSKAGMTTATFIQGNLLSRKSNYEAQNNTINEYVCQAFVIISLARGWGVATLCPPRGIVKFKKKKSANGLAIVELTDALSSAVSKNAVLS